MKEQNKKELKQEIIKLIYEIKKFKDEIIKPYYTKLKSFDTECLQSLQDNDKEMIDLVSELEECCDDLFEFDEEQ